MYIYTCVYLYMYICIGADKGVELCAKSSVRWSRFLARKVSCGHGGYTGSEVRFLSDGGGARFAPRTRRLRSPGGGNWQSLLLLTARWALSCRAKPYQNQLFEVRSTAAAEAAKPGGTAQGAMVMKELCSHSPKELQC